MEYEPKLKDLIQRMKSKGNLDSEKVEEAIRKVPRHLFVPESHKEHAYSDSPLSIGEGQTISQPSVVAKMTQWLEPDRGDKILEIGTGSGWQAAILSRLVSPGGKVYSTERIESLAEKARENLEEAGVENVEIVEGDGSTGLKEYAPYDGVICTAAAPEVPEEWEKQTKKGGRIVAPVGGKFTQSMLVLEKRNGELKIVEEQYGYRFVPLKGVKGF